MVQGLKQRPPSCFPGGEESLPGIFRPDDKLGIPVRPGFVAIRRQKVRPAGDQVPAGPRLGEAVGVRTGLLEEVLVLDLAKCFFGTLLVLAKAEDHVFEVSLPQRHG
jgi:hypothetical protein